MKLLLTLHQATFWIHKACWPGVWLSPGLLKGISWLISSPGYLSWELIQASPSLPRQKYVEIKIASEHFLLCSSYALILFDLDQLECQGKNPMRHQACEIMCQSLKNVCPTYCAYPSLFPIHEKAQHVGEIALSTHCCFFFFKNRSVTSMKYFLLNYCNNLSQI